jgi:hypothetical protein
VRVRVCARTRLVCGAAPADSPIDGPIADHPARRRFLVHERAFLEGHFQKFADKDEAGSPSRLTTDDLALLLQHLNDGVAPLPVEVEWIMSQCDDDGSGAKRSGLPIIAITSEHTHSLAQLYPTHIHPPTHTHTHNALRVYVRVRACVTDCMFACSWCV